LLRKRMKGSLFGKRLYHFFKTDSTNRVAMELGYAGEPEGAVVLAEEQTAGRGRAGRSWHSERGTGIYVTLLLRPNLSPVLAPLLTMLAGLSSRAAIQAQTGLNAELSLVRFVVIGLGINVNQQKFPADISGLATSLRKESGKAHSRLELLVRLLTQFETDYNHFLHEGPSYVVDRFQREADFARGKRVKVESTGDTYFGKTDGLSPEGFLRVMKEDGQVLTVIAGDVTEVQ